MADKPEPVDPVQSMREQILFRMGEGESLRSICRTEGFPTHSAVIQWGYNDAEWANHYARAREAQADALFEDLAEVAEAALTAETAVEVAARRLVVDTHKWRLSKIVPKKYGDKLAIGGADDLPAIQHKTTLTDEQLAAIAAASSH